MTPELLPTLADAWLHDLNPFLLRISGEFGLRWYGLSYSAGFILAWVALKFLMSRGAVLIRFDRAIDVIFAAAFGAVIGGRLGYCLFYRPALLWDFEAGFPFWGVLRLTDGGMASHGGMIGVTIAAWWISRGFKNDDGIRENPVPGLHVADTLALVAPFGLFLGRIANFVNGELLGAIVSKPGEPSPWWAVKFPQEILTDHAPELTRDQALEFYSLLDDYRIDPIEDNEAVYGRVLQALQTGSHDVAARLEPLIAARYPSQLYQAAAEGLLLGVVIWLIAAKARRPGVITAWMLIVYGITRILTEVYRLPDDHLTVARVAGLSRGQWLSVLMIVCGVGLFAWIAKRGRERVGGWWTKTEVPDLAPPTQPEG